jgi:hypothetical protein
VIFAKNREELVAATMALDRVLLWNHYVVPQWTIDKFAHRALGPLWPAREAAEIRPTAFPDGLVVGRRGRRPKSGSAVTGGLAPLGTF